MCSSVIAGHLKQDKWHSLISIQHDKLTCPFLLIPIYTIVLQPEHWGSPKTFPSCHDPPFSCVVQGSFDPKKHALQLQTWISDVGKFSQVLLSFLKQFSNKRKLRLNQPPTKMREVTNYNLAIDPYNLERSLFRNECGVFFFVCVCVHGTK